MEAENRKHIRDRINGQLASACGAYRAGDYERCLLLLPSRFTYGNFPADLRKRTNALSNDAKLQIAKSRTSAPAGRDRWGFFYDFTGHEGSGSCFWCGKSVKNARYCSNDHRACYTRHFWWRDASYWCEKEASGCADCGLRYSYPDTKQFAVHHIVPLNGEDRNWHYLNIPKNLVWVCGKCHMLRHKELNYLLKRAVIGCAETDCQQLPLFNHGEWANGKS